MSAVIRKSSSLITAFSYISNPFLSPKYVSKIQVASMISKAFRDKDFKRPAAFPYKKDVYNLTASLFDRTTWRFDENTKLVVVDGPVASGKDKLAKEIADQFDMLYIPHAHLDAIYINDYGYDFRMANDKLPPHMKSFDIEDYLANPKDRRAAKMQYLLFEIRFRQYVDALAHILNTGQGVVMNRSVFSDMVFVETFVKHGLLPKTYPKYLNQVWNCTKPDFMRPHLVVYLDTPVDVVLQNLKKRNNPVELNSPVFHPDVLKDFEDNYKFKFLQDISSHAELLIYDNSEGVDPEVVVEDMERINLDDYGLHDPKMKDWRFVDESEWCSKRIELSRDRHLLEEWLINIPKYDCMELTTETEDVDIYNEAFEQVPGNLRPYGFNVELGDSVLFKR